MKVKSELQVKIGKEDKIIYFGLPDTKKEMEDMFRLRYEIYKDKGYIDPDAFPDGLDRDQYDKENKCIYSIAKIDDTIVGTARLIRDHFLPIETLCFRFEEPEDIKKIPRDQRVEVSRLVVDSYKQGYRTPRSFVLLFLLHVLCAIAKENNMLAEYAFIKNKIKLKLEKLNVPIHFIDNYTQTYPSDGILYKYFSQKEDKAVPVYFFTTEVENCINTTINNKMFTEIAPEKFIVRNNLYNRFLRLLNVTY